MEQDFIILVGDLIRSTTVSDRDKLQKQLIKGYEEINSLFKDDIYAPIKITKGDEIAAVLTKPNNLYNLADHLLERIHPQRMRFVFVKGKLTTSIETKDAAIIDGPGFNLADELLYQAKKKRLDFVFRLGDPFFDRILNSLTNLIVEFKHGWTETQRRVIKLYKELQNQEKVAKTLGVTQQNIAKILKNTNWKKIQEAEETINSILRDTNRYNLKML